MKYAKIFYEQASIKDSVLPVQILKYAAQKCSQIIGSSTACILVLNPVQRILRSANLGDSGFLLIRQGKAIYHSPQQQFMFNGPYQVLLFSTVEFNNAAWNWKRIHS
jgi:protein phosphatase PTC7